VLASGAGAGASAAALVQPLIIAFLAALFALIAAHVNDAFMRPVG
jgi:hypothetical protein